MGHDLHGVVGMGSSLSQEVCCGTSCEKREDMNNFTKISKPSPH